MPNLISAVEKGSGSERGLVREWVGIEWVGKGVVGNYERFVANLLELGGDMSKSVVYSALWPNSVSGIPRQWRALSGSSDQDGVPGRGKDVKFDI